jgi:hypothetical protein
LERGETEQCVKEGKQTVKMMQRIVTLPVPTR